MIRPKSLAAALLTAAILTGCANTPQQKAAPKPSPSPTATSPSPTPAATATTAPATTPPPPKPTPAWTPCNLDLEPYEGGCETEFITDSCDASYATSDEGLLDAYIENRTFVDANRLKDCPRFLPTWKKALTGFDDGSHEVGKDVKSGTYETTRHLTGGMVMDCYWERTGTNGKIIDNDFVTATKKLRVTIRSSDEMFTSRECGNWVRV